MELLDFPPEIFRFIIHCLVTDAGVVGSWKLRSVCRTFDQEISENVLSMQPHKAFSNYPARYILQNKGNMKYYLAYHVKNPRDVSPELPAKIQKMQEYITGELETVDKVQGRNVLLEVCAGAAYTCRHESFVVLDGDRSHMFWYGKQAHDDLLQRLSQNTTIHDRIISAISVGSYDVVVKLLSQAPASIPQGIFEEPMAAAVLLDDSKMINVMMNVLHQHTSKAFKKSQIFHRESPYSIVSAMKFAIAKDRSDLVDLLLGHLRRYTKLPDKAHYRKWIDNAVHLSNNEALETLLQAVPKERPFHINSTIFAHGCRNNNAAIVSTLLEHGDINLDSNSTSTSTLAIAIRSGSMAAVRTVVEAGADINRAMDTHRFKYRTTITPLEYAIQRGRTNAMAYLVEQGAKLPSPLPSSRSFRKVLREFKTKKDRTTE